MGEGEGLGERVRFSPQPKRLNSYEYGFWLNVFGLFLVVLRVILVAVGGGLELFRRVPSGTGSSPASD